MKKKQKFLILDIETTDFAANKGFMLCYGYKWLGEGKTKVRSLLDYPSRFKRDCTDDSQLAKSLTPLIESADAIITYYGKYFDIPFIQTRQLLNGHPPVSEPFNIDLWWTARKKLKFTSNRLDTVHKALLELTGEQPEVKTWVNPRVWTRAAAGHRASIKEIIHHCRIDIDVTEMVYNHLAPFIKNLPNVHIKNSYTDCPNCGGNNLENKGYYYTLKTTNRRWKCRDCGYNFAGKLSLKVGRS
jgi:uncharacterized protein YprB with RNaseH-like and TPR domain